MPSSAKNNSIPSPSSHFYLFKSETGRKKINYYNDRETGNPLTWGGEGGNYPSKERRMLPCKTANQNMQAAQAGKNKAA